MQRKRASLIEIKTPSRSFTRSLVTCRKSKMMLEYFGSILFDVGELHQHLFCIKKYRKDTLKSFRINLATNS
ncbi:hypothetical protein, partial [Enterococcus faecium]|uniref:hypothetical protein n=8 Tax=Enterococcus faecium TaxID=1352 RepID=UPI000AAC8976